MKLTSPQEFLLHTGLGLLWAALSSGGAAGATAIGSGGHINPYAALVAAVVGFGAAFTRGFVTLEKSPTVQQEAGQAGLDTLAQLSQAHLGALQTLVARLETLFAFLPHATPPPVTPAPTPLQAQMQAAAQNTTTNVQQFRPPVAQPFPNAPSAIIPSVSVPGQ